MNINIYFVFEKKKNSMNIGTDSVGHVRHSAAGYQTNIQK